MDNKAEITQHFNDPLSNRIWSECNITQSNVSSLGDINIKEEPIEYENADQKIPPEEITFVQNIDSKPCLEIGDSKITYNLDTQNVDYDSQPSNHHQFKFEKIQMDITSSGTEAFDKGVVKKEEESYCSKCGFKFDSDDVPSNTICIECNVAEKDVFPLAEKETKSECLEIEDSKISYNLDSQDVHHQFESEDGQKDGLPQELEVHDKEDTSEEKIYYCSKCAFIFDSKLSYTIHLKTQHIVSAGKKLFMCNLCGCESNYKSNIDRHVRNMHTIDDKYKSNPVEGYTQKGEMFKCNLCEYESKRRWGMVRHTKNKHAEHKCPSCVYKTDCKGELKKHLITHDVNEDTVSKRLVFTAQNLYKCKLCEYESRHPSTMYRHKLNKHNTTSVKKHKCSQCEHRTHCLSEMKQHFLIHDDMKPYECEVCNKRFRRSHHLKGHSVTHSGEKRFQCLYCDYKNNYKTTIDIHMKNKHVKQVNKDHKCTQCPYETNSKSHLNRHLKRHLLDRDKEFKCTQCSYDTNFKSDLKIHVQNKHREVKEHKCKQCKYETNCKSNMKKHVQSHDSVKLYECNFCNKLFKRKDSLKDHIRCIHLDEKKFHCAHCDYKTNYKLNLVVHINNKHGTAQDKKYNCARCNYKTDSHQAYEKHLKNHLMKIETVFKCSQCAYETNVSTSLKRHHLRVHNNVKSFECYVCSKRFREKSQLRRHIQDVHISEKKHNCNECNYKTNIKRLFTAHILTNHSS